LMFSLHIKDLEEEYQENHKKKIVV
jgi:hypothetical protein